ncbi:MAG: T9SS type A sorting domain-containing protein [Bacteroidia bacterium]|nr:T9SS type A sorting domain-containing protein [Bacteroidia bacterium]
MRQTLTLLVAMLASFPIWAQSSRILPAGASQNLSPIQRNLVEPLRNTSNVTAPGTNLPVGTITTDAVTAIKVGESSNAFTFITPEQNQISAIKTAGGGSIGFIYRQNIGQCGGQTLENGLYRYAISSNGGTAWNVGSAGTSTAASTPAGCYGIGPINPTYTQVSRYPNFLLSQPGTSTAVADMIGIYAGPVLDPGYPTVEGWDGVVVGVVSDPAGAWSVTHEEYLFQNNNQYSAYSLNERVPGEYWYAAWDYNGQGAPDEVGTELFLNKGVYDVGTGKIAWTVVKSYVMPYVRYFPTGGTDSVNARAGSPNMAFSPDGMTGYVSLLGDIYDRDSVFLPILIETTDGGLTWSDPYEIKMRQFQELVDLLQTFWIVVDTTTGDTLPAGNGVPTTAFDHDLVVDKFGAPHFLAVVANAGSNNADGSRDLPSYSVSSGLRMFMCDFTFDSYGDPNMIVLYAQTTFRGTFGLAGSSNTSDFTTADPWVQMSRSTDGSKIFYSWTESDTTGDFGNNNNSNPDLFTRSLDVDNMKLTQVTNWTGDDATWVSRAVMPKSSPIALDNGAGTYTLPIVIMDAGTNITLLNPVSFWYFSNVSYSLADYTVDAEFFYNCKQNPFTNTLTPTAPGCGLATGSIMLAAGGGIAPYTYEWSASAGGATTPMVSGLAAGIYEVTVTDAAGCVDVLPVTLNNADAPALVVGAVTDITCAGLGNGSAAVTATPVGAATISSYLWSNGETTATAVSLPKGENTVTVTDDQSCVSFESVMIDEPSAISLNTSAVNARCFGDATGRVSATAFGGTGTLSYAWDNGATTSSLQNLVAGSYAVVVTDANGCVNSATVTVTEPAELTLQLSSNGNLATSPPYNGFATANYSGGTDPVTFSWAGPGGFTGTNNIIFGLNGGTYVVTATDGNGCVTVDSVVVTGEVVNAIADELSAGISTMKIFPNPNNGVFAVSLELDRAENVKVEIVNINGQVVQTISERNAIVVDHKFNLSNMASGIYFVQVTTSRGTAGRRIVLR